MVMPYTASDAEQKLLDTYEGARKNPVIGFDGIAEVHLQALNAVAKTVADDTRKRVLAEMQAAPELGVLFDVADAAALLLFFADLAVKNKTPLRPEVKLIAEKLHGLLEAAGYTGRGYFTGHRERPGFPVSPSKYTD